MRLISLALTLISHGTACQPGAGPPPNSPGAAPVAADGGIVHSPGEEEVIRFRDISDSTGIDFVHQSGDSPEKNFPNTLGSGIALLDYDGDGWLDVYFATTHMLPLEAPDCSHGNRLYRNRGDCTFEDVTERAGVGFRGFTHGVAAGDVDGNGFPDLFLTNLGPNVLYLNRGDGTFRDASRGARVEGAGWSTGSAMFDYDNDGDLDLYVSSYGRWTYGGERPFFGNLRTRERAYCPPTTITPERHFLLRNRGDASFEDVTEAAGVLRRDGRGLGVVAADLNGDGLTDLYVANDMSPKFLFLNRGDGTFEDLTESSGAATNAIGKTQASMGIDAEDLTGDGLPELVVTNFREEYTTIYHNLDGRNFQDISSWAGVVPESQTGVGWGCALADLDNDGWPDLVVVNGHVDNNLPIGGRILPQAEPPKVWRNLGEGRFRAVRDAGPFFTSDHVARGAAFGDLDNDGDIDAVVSLMDRRPAVLLNESPDRPWIRLELLTGDCGRPAVGAAVEVHAGGRIIRRLAKGGGSYLSCQDPRLLIGLGSACRVDRVVVDWPGGARSTLTNPSLRQTHRVVEPGVGPPGGGVQRGVSDFASE
jgi:enediyne biosynthesis protein E4